MHQTLGEEAVRRILGVLNLTKKYGVASTDEACAMGLEGIVAKRRDRPYRSGRCADWIKVKNPDAPAATRVIEG